jgi:GTP cyclohydrolase IB
MLKDMQNSLDSRKIPLREAGIRGLMYPVTVLDRELAEQNTVAEISMSVSLPHHFKGTHMSRFIEVLTQFECRFNGTVIPRILDCLRERLNAESARMEVRFPYFISRRAPVTGAEGKMAYRCAFTGQSQGCGDDFVLSVTVPVTTLCPCSREISDSGAHNQRGFLTMSVRTGREPDGSFKMFWIEELVEIGEESASGPLYTILKRPDEKFVTEAAYANPVFVEDMVRNASERLMADSRVEQFIVTAENHESIHNHNAYAVVEWNRTTPEGPLG